MLVLEEIKENEDLLLDKVRVNMQEILPPKALEAYMEYVKELQKLNFNDEEIFKIMTKSL